jgi:Zn-dependent protease
MRFRLFGVPVTIRGWFWITAVLFSLSGMRAVGVAAVPIWVFGMLASLIVHEMGHALAVRRHGRQPEITLHAMGGVTVSDDRGLGRLDRALIDLAGPVAGLIFGGLVYLGARQLPPDAPALLTFALGALLWMNVFWSVINLAPVLPFDGGHILEQALGPRRQHTTYKVSLAFAVPLAALAAWADYMMLALMFAIAAMQSYQRLTLAPGTVLVDPFTGPAGAHTDKPGPLRRWWLQRKLAKLSAEAEGMRSEKPARRRPGAPDLRVIKGGRGEPTKDKRWLN